jgi:glucose/arabinose dehydrogenase
VVLADPHTLYVNIGSATNSCQVQNRVLQSPGLFPCPELPVRAGVWRFDARGTGQTAANGEHWAMGYRNMVALDVNPRTHELWGVQQGRDMLHENWPQLFTVEEGALLPAEELVRIGRGTDDGWPYCSFDAHWSPDGVHFYTGRMFPERYRGGAFVAFHGGFDRAPLPNEGYEVQFVPFGEAGQPSGPAEVFATGFPESAGPLPATAKHRPVGVAEGPDGSLYVSDDRGGRIYRIVYAGR